jgi:hypothetical protein
MTVCLTATAHGLGTPTSIVVAREIHHHDEEHDSGEVAQLREQIRLLTAENAKLKQEQLQNSHIVCLSRANLHSETK